MALANYTNLVDHIKSECDDSSAAFVAKIPDAIGAAEAWFRRVLRADDATAVGTVTANSASTALPADFKDLIAIDVDGSPDQPLESVSIVDLKRAYPTTETGQPRAYAIAGGKLWWGPVPNASCTINLIYSSSLPGLQANTTNWLMTAHPDLYVAGSLAYAYKWLGDAEKAALNLSLAEDIIAQINKESALKRAGAAPIAPRSFVAQVRGVRI